MKEKFDFSRPEDQQKFEKLTKEEKDSVISKNQAEANMLKGKIKLHESKNYNEASEKFDELLSSKEILNRPKFSLQNLKFLEKQKPYGYSDDYNFSDLNEYDEDYDEKYNKGREKNKIRYNKIDNCDKILIEHPDYERVRGQNIFIKTKGNLIILYSGGSRSEMYMSLKNFSPYHIHEGGGESAEETDEYLEKTYGEGAKYEGRIIKAKKIFEKYSSKEIDKNPDLQEIIKKGYDSLFQDGAIIAEQTNNAPEIIENGMMTTIRPSGDAKKFIEEGMGKGEYIIDVLKKAEERGLIKLRNVPTFYTDIEERKKREDEINEILDAERDEVETELRSDEESRIIFKQKQLEKQTKEDEEKQKMIKEKYGNILNEKGGSLSDSNLSALNKALMSYNGKKSHSPVYREYERTEGLDIKDDIAVFIVEKSSLNLEGKGGEEIDIELILVDNGQSSTVEEFKVRDRWDQRKDNFHQWYRDIKIDKFDEKNNSISLKLKNKDGEERWEIIDLKKTK